MMNDLIIIVATEYPKLQMNAAIQRFYQSVEFWEGFGSDAGGARYANAKALHL